MTNPTKAQLEVIKPLAPGWYAAEFHSNTGIIPRTVSDGDVLAVAVPRIMQVFNGEVRYSEASAGDRSIWGYRPRFITSWLQGRPVSEPQWPWLFPKNTIVHNDVRMFDTQNCGGGELVILGGLSFTGMTGVIGYNVK